MRMDGMTKRREGEMRGRVRRRHGICMHWLCPLFSLVPLHLACLVRSAPFRRMEGEWPPPSESVRPSVVRPSVGRTNGAWRVFTEPQHNLFLFGSKSLRSSDPLLRLPSVAHKHSYSLCKKRRLYTGDQKGRGQSV